MTQIAAFNQVLADAAEKRVNFATRAINELQGQISAEGALRKAGSASNIANLQNEIKEQKKVRQQALKD